VSWQISLLIRATSKEFGAKAVVKLQGTQAPKESGAQTSCYHAGAAKSINAAVISADDLMHDNLERLDALPPRWR
jgi:hypothetical protein